ncbi:MAG TPA: threonine/serine exporter family protein [Chitinophagaceae bacterium]
MDAAKQNEMVQLGHILLQVGSLLMSAGANTGRIRITITRIADAFGYRTEMLISHRTIMLTLLSESDEHFFTNLKRTHPHGVNFKILSGISRMSWRVVAEKWSLEQINAELARLTALPHYPRWLTLTLVSLAGAAFCRLANGSPEDMIIVFAASFLGLLVRQETVRMGFNAYLCVYFAALTAALVAGLPLKLDAPNEHEPAFATCVLFLIPGVPLINSFSDLIDGNIQIGMVRGINGLIIAFAIALGLSSAVIIYQI